MSRLPLLLLLAACKPWITDAEFAERADVDGDGYLPAALGGEDCDDTNAAVHPDAVELCDAVDHNCDGAILPCEDGVDNAERTVVGGSEESGLGTTFSWTRTVDGEFFVMGAPGYGTGGSIYLYTPPLGLSSAEDSPAILRGSANSGVGTSIAALPEPPGVFFGRPGEQEARIQQLWEGVISDTEVGGPPPFSPDLAALGDTIDNTVDFGWVMPFDLDSPGLGVFAPSARQGGGAARGAVFSYTGDPPNFSSPNHAVGGLPTERIESAALMRLTGVDPNPELVIGTPLSSKVHIFLTAGNGLDLMDADLVISGPDDSDFGEFLHTVDLDGDALPELITSAPDANGAAGVLYVFWNQTIQDAVGTLPADQADLVFTGEDFGDEVENAAFGDVNGDGELDALFGAPGAADGAGRIYLHLGPLESGGVGEADAIWTGDDPGGIAGDAPGALGSQVALAEIDEQGTASIIATAPFANTDEHVDAGAVYVFELPRTEE